MAGEKIDNQAVNKQLKQGIGGRDFPISDFPFVGEDLVKMQPVRFEDVLTQVKPVENGVDGIDAVNGQEKQPNQGVGGHHQLQNQDDNPKGNTHAADVAGEAFRPFPEVEKQEYQAGQSGIIDKIGGSKRLDFAIDVLQGNQNG